MIPPPIFEFRRVEGLTWRSVLFLIVTALTVVVFAIRARRNRAWWRAIDAEWEKYRAIQEAADETRWQS